MNRKTLFLIAGLLALLVVSAGAVSAVRNGPLPDLHRLRHPAHPVNIVPNNIPDNALVPCHDFVANR